MNLPFNLNRYLSPQEIRQFYELLGFFAQNDQKTLINILTSCISYPEKGLMFCPSGYNPTNYDKYDEIFELLDGHFFYYTTKIVHKDMKVYKTWFIRGLQYGRYKW